MQVLQAVPEFEAHVDDTDIFCHRNESVTALSTTAFAHSQTLACSSVSASLGFGRKGFFASSHLPAR